MPSTIPSAVFAAGMSRADGTAVWARRQVTADPASLRAIRSRRPSSSPIPRTRTHTVIRAG
ncbi:hypothetical protein [Streptomyces enissocaesilis]